MQEVAAQVMSQFTLKLTILTEAINYCLKFGRHFMGYTVYRNMQELDDEQKH